MQGRKIAAFFAILACAALLLGGCGAEKERLAVRLPAVLAFSGGGGGADRLGRGAVAALRPLFRRPDSPVRLFRQGLRPETAGAGPRGAGTGGGLRGGGLPVL